MIALASPLAQFRAHEDAIRAAVDRVLTADSYILGQEVAAFEGAFAAYCGSAHAVGVANGTDALILALRALDIGQGDEVITVSHTALATVAGVIATGATPVLVDIDPVHYTIDPAGIETAITSKTRAIIAVYLYGQAADLSAIQAIARHHGLKLIEDCAQATGARLGDKVLGSIGDMGCFSFYPTKNLGGIGDGGMVVTSDQALADRVRRLREYGWNEKREAQEIGVNSRLDALQAAILGVKLPHLDAGNQRRAAIAAHYDAGLSGLGLTLPAVRPGSLHVYHLYVLACDDRDGLQKQLAVAGVSTGIHYPVPAHLQKGYEGRVRLAQGGLAVTTGLVSRILSLPMYPELGDAEVKRIIDTVKSIRAGVAAAAP
jgi:dTDP-4-amino-4,6-dideoxygalactose transaminase